TNYTYDANNNLIGVVQNTSHNRTFAYDSVSRLTRATNPESGAIAYSYDANGNLAAKTSPAQNQTGTATITTNYSYDALNRNTQRSYSGGTVATPSVTYTYDQSSVDGFTLTNTVGRLVKATTGAPWPTAEYYTYDQMGRVTNEGQCVFINNCGTSNPSLW